MPASESWVLMKLSRKGPRAWYMGTQRHNQGCIGNRKSSLTGLNIIVENILPPVTECHTLHARQYRVGAAIRKVRESFCPPCPGPFTLV